jgi:hypothetical protein
VRGQRARTLGGLGAEQEEHAAACAQEELAPLLGGELAETQDIHVETLRPGEVLDVKNGLEHAGDGGKLHRG